jgi:hypothetical protein
MALLFGGTGCISDFQVYRAQMTEDGKLKITDPEPVPLPSSASNKIGVYWTDHGRRQVNGRPMPKRPYEVIGRVNGVLGVALQTDVVLDASFRRAAAAIGGDAVIDAKRGKYMEKSTGNEYTGKVIKWKSATNQASQ